MKRLGIAAAVAGLLVFPQTVWGDGAAQHDHSKMTTEEHQHMDMGGMDMGETGAKSAGTDGGMEGMDMGHGASSDHTSHGGASGGSAHQHGAEADLTETPPNTAVLGTFGAVMGAFILYGAVTKYYRRKERVPS